MSERDRPARRVARSSVVGGAAMAAALGVMNLTTYGLTLACARWLGPDEFGQFSSVLGALIVLNVVSLALQATAARRVSTAVGDLAPVAASVRAVGLRAAAVVTLVGLVLAPLVARGLRLDSVGGAFALAVAAGLLTLMGAQAGVLQGSGRWRALAGVYAAMGTARLVVGVGALALDRTAAAALVGVAVAALVPVAVGRLALGPVGHGSDTPVREVVREVAHSAGTLFAFFALTNVDVLLARAVLPGTDAGHYAAGLVLTKAMLFLPQVVVVVLFPRLARGHDVRRTHAYGLGAIAALGVAATAGVLVLPGLALAFVGGSAYRPVGGDLWLFATLGTVLAMVQLLVYGALARRHPRAVLLLWAAFAATAAAALAVDTAHGLLLVKLGVDAVLLVALAAVLLALPARTPDPAGEDPAELSPETVR